MIPVVALVGRRRRLPIDMFHAPEYGEGADLNERPHAMTFRARGEMDGEGDVPSLAGVARWFDDNIPPHRRGDPQELA